MELLTRPSQPSGHAIRVDSEYLRSWRDLRRREFLFWFFVLSYVPSIAIIIVHMDRFGSDVLDRIATFFPLPGWSDLPAQVFIVRISAVRVVTNFSFGGSSCLSHTPAIASTATSRAGRSILERNH